MDVLDIHDRFWYKRKRVPPWIWVFIIPLGCVAILGGRYLDDFRTSSMDEMASPLTLGALPSQNRPHYLQRGRVNVVKRAGVVQRGPANAQHGPHP